MSTDESNLSQNSIFKTVLFKSQQFNRFLKRKSDISLNTNDENSLDINIEQLKEKLVRINFYHTNKIKNI